MANVFIIHGAYGNPEENWFPWLKKELEKLGHKVFVPHFPTPDSQSLNNWLKVFAQYRKYLDDDRHIDNILIGHSIGAAFLLNVIEDLDKPIKASFFIAGFISPLNNQIDELNKTFYEKKFDWEKIKRNCQKFFVFHSDDDPYVPLNRAKELADKLGTNVILVKNAGHFNTKAGYSKFPQLLHEILKL